MAKKKNEPKFNFNESIRDLKQNGPEKLYLIWGPEDYLAEKFYEAIKAVCLGDTEDDFSYRKLNERDFSVLNLTEAIDSVPFLSERTLVEVKGVDLNTVSHVDELIKALSDIPDYCTVVFLSDNSFEPDKRLKIYKTFAKHGVEFYISAQDTDHLVKWIVKRFAALDKSIETNAIQRLIAVSGDIMSRLIPEINKVASYAKGDKVTIEDVNAVAHHIPEAMVFDMTECISNGEYNSAMILLSELLDDKDNDPIFVNAVLAAQMRKLYAARLAIDNGLGKEFVMKTCSVKYDFLANRLLSNARKFKKAQLKRAIELCAETDYALKSSRTDPVELLKECVMRVCAGEADE